MEEPSAPSEDYVVTGQDLGQRLSQLMDLLLHVSYEQVAMKEQLSDLNARTPPSVGTSQQVHDQQVLPPSQLGSISYSPRVTSGPALKQATPTVKEKPISSSGRTDHSSSPEESIMLADLSAITHVKKSTTSKRREGSNSHTETPRRKRSGDSDPSSSDSDSTNDNSGDQFSDPDPEDRDKYSRRRSLFQDARKSTKEAEKILTIRTPPPYDHIMLKTLGVTDVIDFFDAVDLYQIKNGVVLPTATLTTKSIRETLIAKSGTLGLSQFFALDTSKLLRLIQKYLRPRNAIAFVTARYQKILNFKIMSRNYIKKNIIKLIVFCTHDNITKL
jgi:hypothetical protein